MSSLINSMVPCLRKDAVKACDPSQLHTNETIKKAAFVALSLLLIGGGVAICMNMQVFPTTASCMLVGSTVVIAGLILSSALLSYCRPTKETVVKTSLFVLSILLIGGGVAVGMSQVFPTTAACILAGATLGTGGLIIQGFLLNSCRQPQTKISTEIDLDAIPVRRRVGRNVIEDVNSEPIELPRQFYAQIIGLDQTTREDVSTKFSNAFAEQLPSNDIQGVFNSVIERLRDEYSEVKTGIGVLLHDRNAGNVLSGSIRGSFKYTRTLMMDIMDESDGERSPQVNKVSRYDGVAITFHGKMFAMDPNHHLSSHVDSFVSLRDSLCLSGSSLNDSFSSFNMSSISALSLSELIASPAKDAE